MRTEREQTNEIFNRKTNSPFHVFNRIPVFYRLPARDNSIS